VKNKQAVVVIHGMGEQIPMETLTSFIDAVWTHDPSLTDRETPDANTGDKRKHNASWSKPDVRTRSFELRRVTTELDKTKRRTDFYEYYWAHHMTDTTWQMVRAWFFTLMWRNPFCDVPKRVFWAWGALWLVALSALAVTIWSIVSPPDWKQVWSLKLAAAAAALAAGGVIVFLVAYFGDVARYVRAKPANVGIRQAIREEGVQLLETLMGRRDDGTWGDSEYDRVVVAAHSLGSVVAYDMLTHAFARLNQRRTPDRAAAEPARLALETMVRGAVADGKLDVHAFQAAQGRAREELVASGNPWIVSDFVTMGCPLVHADFLIARNRKALGEAKRQRILPTCPPILEHDRKTNKTHFTYRPREVAHIGDGRAIESPRVPHHAALFAYTRWSNLHSPSSFLLWGDIISGPLNDAMGIERGDGTSVSGIRDVQVMPIVGSRGRPFLAHIKYWKMRGKAPSEQAIELRKLLRIVERAE
jgi:hypothetical protein